MIAREAIEFRRVSRRFRTDARGDVWALRDFDLECREEQWCCLLGPSGCGKTTLLRLAAGLDRPTAGEVFLSGGRVHGPSKGIALLSQECGLLPWRTVLDNVALGLEIRGICRGERVRRALAAIRRVRLPEETARSRVHELSGGMRQRVALAGAVCADPRIVLLDEPFARVDEPTRHRLQDELLDLWLADRKTILLVTHSVEEAVFLADRIVVMDFGGIVAEVDVALPRPRERFGEEFFEVMRRVRGMLPRALQRNEHDGAV